MASIGPVTHIVVHYSATYSDQDVTASDIDRMHKARGWRGIGYHAFIRRNGLVEDGRPWTELGAHVGGQNKGKLGVCWAGGLDRATGPNVGVDNMTPEQDASLRRVIGQMLGRWPGAKVVGHRDLAATQCPGFDVAAWWTKRPVVDQPLATKSVVVSETPESDRQSAKRSFWAAFLRFLKGMNK